MPQSLFKLQSQKPSDFFPRILGVASAAPLAWPCSVCPPSTTAHTNKCPHLEVCTECTNYQIDKILRCDTCCQGILGTVPAPCGSHCSRVAVTHKSTAKCDTCGLALRKRCTSCKNDPDYKAAKKALKTQVKVYVTAVSSLKAVDIRPCSHCRVCVKCNNSLTKGHRERGVCGPCKNGGSKRANETVKPIAAKLSAAQKHEEEAYAVDVLQSFKTVVPSPTPTARRSILRDSSSEVSNTSFLVKRQLPAFDTLVATLNDSAPLPPLKRMCQPATCHGRRRMLPIPVASFI